MNRFHCAARWGLHGWAYTWAHDEFDPCTNCPIKIEGKRTNVNGELPSKEFPELAGKLIRSKDWSEIKKRGYTIGIKGMKRL